MLERHSPSLHAVFSAYAASGDDGSTTGGANAGVLSYAEWMDMLGDLHMIDDDFTQCATRAEAHIARAAARMQSFRAHTPRARSRLRHDQRQDEDLPSAYAAYPAPMSEESHRR